MPDIENDLMSFARGSAAKIWLVSMEKIVSLTPPPNSFMSGGEGKTW
jgi:hypothetical protein